MGRADGRVSRHQRVAAENGGAWASASVDFASIAARLLTMSASEAKRRDGNHSDCVLAGIPVLFSMVRCLLVELNAGMHTMTVPDSDALAQLAASSADHEFAIRHYRLDARVAANLRVFWEVRCEIVHPAHRPGPEPDNTPDHLRVLKERGLLQSTGREADYFLLDQLKSHRLFVWGWEVIESAMLPVLESHRPPQWSRALVEDALGLYRRAPTI